MRIIGLNLLVAIALFGVAYANSDRQQVADAYRAFVEAHASGNPYAICAQEFPSTGPGETREDQLDDCVERFSRYRSNNPSQEEARRWRTLLGSDVTVKVSHGDSASAIPRVDGCTLEVLELGFELADDGRWYERTYTFGDEGLLGPCKEGGRIPPAELAWTWQNRQWR